MERQSRQIICAKGLKFLKVSGWLRKNRTATKPFLIRDAAQSLKGGNTGTDARIEQTQQLNCMCYMEEDRLFMVKHRNCDENICIHLSTQVDALQRWSQNVVPTSKLRP